MKKKILILCLVLLIIGSFFSVNFIKDARKNRTWPFNSSIGLYLPQWVKFYAYKYTNPNEKKITTQYYKIKLDYVTILINLKVVLETSQEKENKQNDISKQISNNKKMGRNEPCFCGSGKKFKHCHGAI